MTDEGRGYAAGLFEGEGTVGLYPQTWADVAGRRHQYPRGHMAARIVMTDVEPLRAFHAIVGLGTITGPYLRKLRPNERAFYVWSVQTSAGVRALYDLIGSLLSPRRKAQFESALKADHVL